MKRILLGLALAAALLTPLSASAEDGDFEFRILGSEGGVLWIADYLRALPSGYAWDDGDRSGYFCVYAFLVDSRGRVVGRVWAHNIKDASVRNAPYARIIDEDMDEGARFFNGTLAPPGSNELGDCPVSEVSYEPYTGPTQEPVVTYESARGGAVLETRDYPALDVLEGTTFQVIENTPSRVALVAYQNTKPQVVFYYDSLSPRVVMAADLG